MLFRSLCLSLSLSLCLSLSVSLSLSLSLSLCLSLFLSLSLSQLADGDSEALSAFFSRNSYLSGRYDDGGCFSLLNAHLASLSGGPDAHRLFYLALPPSVYHHVSKNIQAHCMSHKSVPNTHTHRCSHITELHVQTLSVSRDSP